MNIFKVLNVSSFLKGALMLLVYLYILQVDKSLSVVPFLFIYLWQLTKHSYSICSLYSDTCLSRLNISNEEKETLLAPQSMAYRDILYTSGDSKALVVMYSQIKPTLLHLISPPPQHQQHHRARNKTNNLPTLGYKAFFSNSNGHTQQYVTYCLQHIKHNVHTASWGKKRDGCFYTGDVVVTKYKVIPKHWLQCL